MFKMLRMTLLTCLLAAAFAAQASATTLAVVPSTYATAEAPGEMSEPLIGGASGELAQYVFDASHLSGLAGQTLTGLTFRLDGTYDSDTTARAFADYTVKLGIWSGGTFSNTPQSNLNASVSQTVRTGAFTFTPGATSTTYGAANGFGNFMTFQTPFAYGGGDLLVTLSHSQVDAGHSFVSTDSFANAQTVFSHNANAYNTPGYTHWQYAPVIQFTTSTLTPEGTVVPVAPVPEPSTLILLGAGLVVARRKFQK